MANKKIHIEDLLMGDKIDLEGDEYAKSSDMASRFEFEYVTVEGIEEETSDCTRVDFTDVGSIGFPPDHQVKILKRDVVINVWCSDDPDGWLWDDTEDHGGFDRISPNGPFKSELDAIIDAEEAFKGSHVVYVVGQAPFHYFDGPDGPVHQPKGDSSGEALRKMIDEEIDSGGFKP